MIRGSPWVRELEVARRAALDAGALVKELYDAVGAGATVLEVEMKAPGDPVTAADRVANDSIVRALSRAFPEDALLAEESGMAGAQDPSGRRWCIDPLDGTKEFLARNGEFAVMVGLAKGGRPVVGVVYQPATDLLLEGAEGEGAFVTEGGVRRAVRVSDISEPAAMRLVVSRSHRSPIVDAVKASLAISSERPSGSVGLKIGLLVRNEADLYLHPGRGTKLWDACAPEAILKAAGGQLTDARGNLIAYDATEPGLPSGIVASNALAHDRVIQAVRAVTEGTQ